MSLEALDAVAVVALAADKGARIPLVLNLSVAMPLVVTEILRVMELPTEKGPEPGGMKVTVVKVAAALGGGGGGEGGGEGGGGEGGGEGGGLGGGGGGLGGGGGGLGGGGEDGGGGGGED